MEFNWLRRHWRWIVVIAIAIITAAVLISIFRSNPFCEFVIYFFNDWSLALSAGATLLLVYITLMTVRENRRITILGRIQDWANESIRLLDAPRWSNSHLVELAELENDLQSIKTRSISALADSKKLGKELENKVKQACWKLETYSALVMNRDSSGSDFENAHDTFRSSLID
ncbi:MAG: hypothetical protein PVJ61_04600, partial [Dehalococcoidia bacterium]